MSSANDGVDDAERATWRLRQANLLRELDDLQTRAESDQRDLCRAISRLTQATIGLDPGLDPHLARIRELLRNGLPTGALREELSALTDTLVRSQPVAESNEDLIGNSELLFQYLLTAAPRRQMSVVELLRRRVETGALASEAALFQALADTFEVVERRADASESAKSGGLGRLFGRGAASTDAATSSSRHDTRNVRERLSALLQAMDVPAEFAHRVRDIAAQLSQDLDWSELPSALVDAAALLEDVRAWVEQERSEVQEFLAQLSGKLNELELQAVGINTQAQASIDGHEVGTVALQQEFDGLRQSTHDAKDLHQLRELVSQRLDIIAERLRAAREEEIARLRETEHQLADMSGKLHVLERESGELRSKLRLAHDRALRDTLTGLPNRAAYEERLSHAIIHWQRFGHPLALLVWDVDLFKGINDRYGHAAGDRVLVAVARTLANSIRGTDFVARYGGEEFVMLLVGADADSVLQLANILREKVQDCGFSSGTKRVVVTISCGIALFQSGDNGAMAFERADQALYRAKALGRNRCEIAYET